MIAQRGFGLVELLFAMALGSMTCLAALSLMDASSRSFHYVERESSTVESGEVAASMLVASLSNVRTGLCGPEALWRNHLKLSDASWWNSVKSGMRVYGADEVTPGTLFGSTAARRVDGTSAIDIFRFEVDAAVLLEQDAPSADLEVSSIQGFSAGDVAVVCSPVSADVFMVSGKSSGSLSHGSIGANAFGLSNCSSEFHEGSECAGIPRCVASGENCPSLVAHRLGRVRAERWYIGWSATGRKSLYMSELENVGLTSLPTAVRPSEIMGDIRSLSFSQFADTAWIPVVGSALDGRPTMVSLESTDGQIIRRFLRMGTMQ